MTHTVKIVTQESKMLEEYWEMRAIKRSICIGRGDLIVKRSELQKDPTFEEIARFLSDSNADFVSVEHNYRFVEDLPFC